MNECPFFDFASQNQKMGIHSKYSLVAQSAMGLFETDWAAPFATQIYGKKSIIYSYKLDLPRHEHTC
jgi:hypothetical protein